MKDGHDASIADMYPIKPRRGRLPTGQAKSAAERKRQQREKDRTRPVEEWSMETLLRAVATATRAGDVGILAAGCAELKRRAMIAAKARRYGYEIQPRPAELGGGWLLRLFENGEVVGGGVFPLAPYLSDCSSIHTAQDREMAEVAAYEDAVADASFWLAGCEKKTP